MVGRPCWCAPPLAALPSISSSTSISMEGSMARQSRCSTAAAHRPCCMQAARPPLSAGMARPQPHDKDHYPFAAALVMRHAACRIPCLWICQQAWGMQEAWPAPRQRLVPLEGVQ